VQKWFETLELSSIPLRELGPDLMPICVASGCLVEYSGKRLLLSVQHATGNMGNWAVEVEFDPSKGTMGYQLGQMNFLKRGSLNTGQVKDVDFSYAEVPMDLQPRYQRVSSDGDIELDLPHRIVTLDFAVAPPEEKKYGFSGQIMSQRKGKFLTSQPVVYHDLTFEGPSDDYFVFGLPMGNPGSEYFKGCSGAPIMDPEGNVVALVSHGYPSQGAVYGVSLRAYKVALDILVGNVT
jgi:hypothetical protein